MDGLFAQVQEPISGIYSLVLQGGSFALLAYVVVYLAPQLLREARAERETWQKQANEERAQRSAHFRGALEVMEAKFDARSDKVVAAIGVQTNILCEKMDDSNEAIREAMKFICKGRPA